MLGLSIPHIGGRVVKPLAATGVIGGGALVAGCGGASKVENAAFEGTSKRDTVTGQKDNGNNGWKMHVARSFEGDVNINGATNGNQFTVTSRDRGSGTHGILNASTDGAGNWFGSTSGVVESVDSDGRHHANPFHGGFEAKGDARNWRGKIDTAGKKDVKFAGSSNGDSWEVKVDLPWMGNRSYKGSGSVSIQQQMAIAMQAYTHEAP